MIERKPISIENEGRLPPDTFGMEVTGAAEYDRIRQAAPNIQLPIGAMTLADQVMVSSSREFRVVERPTAARYLADARDQIAGLDEKQAAVLDAYLDRYAPAELKAFKAGEADAHRQVTWQDWMTTASPKELTQVLEWHVGNVAELNQSPDVRHTIARERATYKQGLDRAIKAGWIAETAHKAIRQVDTTTVYVGDVFDTTMRGTLGYHLPHQRTITVQQDWGETVPNVNQSQAFMTTRHLQDTLGHEFNHLLPGFKDRWINEALAEHIDLAMKSGRLDAIDPARWRHNVPVYEEERQLLLQLLDGPHGTVDIRMATRAFSGTPDDAKQFYDALQSAWGMDAYAFAAGSVRRYKQFELTKVLNRGGSIRDVQRLACLSVRSDMRSISQSSQKTKLAARAAR